MKHIAFIVCFLFCSLIASAQDKREEDMSIEAAINACINIRDAVAANDTAAIRQAARSLEAAGTRSFKSLQCMDDTIASLEGHLVFNEAFADSLAEGKNVYRKANDISHIRTLRGQNANGSIRTNTCFVKAGKSTKWAFYSKGHQELAIVAEAGGLVTMKIHVTNSAGFDKRFDDTEQVKTGRPQRKTSFELPKDKKNTVELEVVNCGKKDCSFVVISN
jgi:hypothetical protein